ncbi:MAG: DUF4184 family protein [Chitinophagales bacterium]|nr:DUF4184 family protein [Chitinophagales bacterium]
MPYTLVHQGFVLPLARWLPRYFHVPALIVGSWVPDLDIIYRFSETRYHLFSYSKVNILFVLIPIGVLMTYFLSWIWIPLAQYGTVSRYRQDYIASLKKLPQIVLSVGLAIILHLYLDKFSHLNDAEGLGLRIGTDLGYENNEMQPIFTLLSYLPQIALSVIGLLLVFFFIWSYRKDIFEYTAFLRANISHATILFLLISIGFAAMKVIKAGIEQHKSFDSIAIGITCGLMSAFFLLPLALFLYLRLRNVKDIATFSIPILSIYMLGLVSKELLSIYIAKMVFISILIFNFSFIIKKDNSKVQMIFVLLLDIFLTLFHPFSSYFTILLFYKNILLVLLYFIRNLDNSIYYSLIKGMVMGCLTITAYYASNKGSGWGIVLLMLSAIVYELSLNSLLIKKQGLLSFISKCIISAIIFSVNIKLGIFVFGFLILLGLMEWKVKNFQSKYSNLIFFLVIMPLTAISYIGFYFSIAYALFSMSILLLLISIIFWGGENSLKSSVSLTPSLVL